jgi:hypothetical protein
MPMDPQLSTLPSLREYVEFHKTEDEYGLTKDEREWLRGLYERYRQEVPREDALKELLWNVDRDSMDDQQLHSKLQGTFPAYSPQQGLRVRSVSPSASTSPQTTALSWTDFTMPVSTHKVVDQGAPLNPPSQLPMPVLSFEQLLDYAVMVKTQCAARSVSDQMTLDAFVLLGGCEDGSGEVQLDTLRQTILDFHLNIDVESFVAAVDKDGDGTIMYHEFAWLYNEGLMELTTSPSSVLVTKTPSNFFAPVAHHDGASDSAGAKGSRNVSPIAGLTSPSLHSAKVPGETPPHPASGKLDALQVSMSRASVARALSMANVDFQGVSPSKRSGAGHNKQRTRPHAVPCRDLADPETVMQRLEDVAVTHEHRLAYGEVANRRHLAEASSQGNHLLADNVNDLFFKRNHLATADKDGQPPRNSSAAAAAVPSEASETPRRQRVTLKAKVDYNVPRSAARPPPSPRRPPTVAELVQQKLVESSPSTSARRNHWRVADRDQTATAAAEVQQAMETLHVALQKLEVARQHSAAALPLKSLHHQKVQRQGVSHNPQAQIGTTISNSVPVTTTATAQPAPLPPHVKCDRSVEDNTTHQPPSTAHENVDNNEEEYDNDEFEATDVSAHNTTAAGINGDNHEMSHSPARSSSTRSSSSSRSPSNSSRSFSVASSSTCASVQSRHEIVDIPASSYGPPNAAATPQPSPVPPRVTPQAPASAPSTRSSRLRHGKQHPAPPPADHVAPRSELPPTRPSSAKHHLLSRRPQTASSQSRLCRTTGRAYDDHKLSRVASTITSTQNQRVVDALKRCAAEGNAVTLVSTSASVRGMKDATSAAGMKLDAAETGTAEHDAQLMDRWTRR